jgi:hypothetical protein
MSLRVSSAACGAASAHVPGISTTGTAGSCAQHTLSDADHHTYEFTHLRLAGHAAVRVHTGTGRDSNTNVYQDRRAYVWNNNHDTATLSESNGRIADSKSWGHGHRR